MKRRLHFTAGAWMIAVCFFWLAGTFSVSGAIIANFDEGNTATEVDGYPGMAGNGWAGGWTHSLASSPQDPDAVVLTVTDTSPLSTGSGNYLSISHGAGNRELDVDRAFTNYGSVNLSQNHSVLFDFRIDDITAWNDSAATWIRIQSTDSAASPNNTRMRWQALTRNFGTYVDWMFRDGDRAGGQTFISSGIAVQEGVTYSFRFDVVPSTGSYFVTLTDSLDNSFVSGELGFRNDDTVGGSYIGFNNQKGSDAVDSPMAYSIDNIQIIPEPTTILLLVVAGGALGVMRRRLTPA